jgi:hypothetical protein
LINAVDETECTKKKTLIFEKFAKEYNVTKARVKAIYYYEKNRLNLLGAATG